MKRALLKFGLSAVIAAATIGTAIAGTITFRGQGLIADGFGGYDLQTELCGVQNGADAEGPYLLWVFTASGGTSPTITLPGGVTALMTRTSNGSYKYVGPWTSPATLPGAVSVSYGGNAKNPQLVVSHGCRPYTKQGAWCSPGFWGNAMDGAWALTGRVRTDLFNSTVAPGFHDALGTDASVGTVLTTTGGTYKGAGVAGTDPRTQAPNPALNAFNATGAYLTDQIPGFTYDPTLLSDDDSATCPIDHFGHFKNP